MFLEISLRLGEKHFSFCYPTYPDEIKIDFTGQTDLEIGASDRHTTLLKQKKQLQN
jgi:hypothetical protein